MAQGKKTVDRTVVMAAGDMSGSLTSSTIVCKTLDRVMVHVLCVGTATGTITIEGSNDGVAWGPLAMPIPALSGLGDEYFFDIVTTAAPMLRVVFTRTAGIGSMDVDFTSKES